MKTRVDRLRAEQERAEQQKHEAERKAKLAKKKLTEELRKERNHRLIVRGAYLEKLLREPDMLTDEDVFRILDHAFATHYVRDHLTDFLTKKHQEATKETTVQAATHATETGIDT